MMLFEPRWKSYIVASNDAIFTKEQCEQIIRVGQSQEQKKAQVGIDTVDKEGKKISPDLGITDDKKRITTISWLPFGSPDTQPIYGKINEWIMSNMPPVRKISMTLLLSDENDFEGGDLELIDDKSRPKMKQGHALFFASFIRHRVTPVTKGNRKSLVMWFGGPSFK